MVRDGKVAIYYAKLYIYKDLGKCMTVKAVIFRKWCKGGRSGRIVWVDSVGLVGVGAKKTWVTLAGFSGLKPKGKICDSNRVVFATSILRLYLTYIHLNPGGVKYCDTSRRLYRLSDSAAKLHINFIRAKLFEKIFAVCGKISAFCQNFGCLGAQMYRKQPD